MVFDSLFGHPLEDMSVMLIETATSYIHLLVKLHFELVLEGLEPPFTVQGVLSLVGPSSPLG